MSICSRKGIRMATAESCTGGYIASRITDVPGSSACFTGGIVAYSNELKTDLLYVNSDTLDRFGAVSPQTAEEMASGLRRRTGADISLSSTGIAGPDGGTEVKPVGTVYLGIASGDESVHSEGFHLKGLERIAFKEKVSRIALSLLLGHADHFRSPTLLFD